MIFTWLSVSTIVVLIAGFVVILHGFFTYRQRIFNARATTYALRAERDARSPFSSRKKPEWVIRELIRLAALHPKDTGCRTLSVTFNRCFGDTRGVRGMTISKSFVSYTRHNHLYEIKRLRETFKRRIPPPMRVNRVWGIDLTGKQDALGNRLSIFGIIDHGSRMSMSLRALPRACSWTLLGCLCFAVAKYGKPRVIRTDNGRNFTSKTFRTFLRIVGIHHQRTELSCPWQNGRIERFFGTLKSKLDLIHVNDLFHLQLLLNEFTTWYNVIRPHQHLGGKTPLEQWCNIDIESKPPRSAILWQRWSGLLAGVVLRR